MPLSFLVYGKTAGKDVGDLLLAHLRANWKLMTLVRDCFLIIKWKLMLRDFLNGSREVAARVITLRSGLRFGLVRSYDACRLMITLAGLFQLDVVLSMQRLIDLCHIHHHILLRRWVMVLSSCFGLAITKASLIFITEGFHFIHFSLITGLIGQSHLWLLPIF